MPITLTPAQCARAASAYRALLRAQRFTFKGDDLALRAAHLQTRVLFNRFIPSASSATQSPFSPTTANSTIAKLPELKPREEELTEEKINEHIEGAFEIATYLRRNVVQGRRTEEGNYALRITEETERGDNETIRQPKDARVMRGPREGGGGAVASGNEGVRRRRRNRKPATEEEGEQLASKATTEGGCCGGPKGTPGP
ncbi:Mzm1p [Sporobolomyces salmoneus]|uniref:Mzm1p n=1 Tax=Sporobolomyces salmoneus TaxID=183962 RepID=UPI003179D2DE